MDRGRGGGAELLLGCGRHEVKGELHPSPNKTPPFGVILCHGAAYMGRTQPLIAFLARRLATRYPVVTFDFPGFGSSPPLTIRSFEDLDFSDCVRGATEFMRSRRGLRSVTLGHSMGGVYALINAPSDPNTLALSMLASLHKPPQDPAYWRAMWGEAFQRMPGGKLELSLEEVANLFAERSSLIEDSLRRLNPKPLLAIQAELEEYPPIASTAKEAFELPQGPKRLVVVEGANHRFEGKHRQVGRLVEEWLSELDKTYGNH